MAWRVIVAETSCLCGAHVAFHKKASQARHIITYVLPSLCRFRIKIPEISTCVSDLAIQGHFLMEGMIKRSVSNFQLLCF